MNTLPQALKELGFSETTIKQYKKNFMVRVNVTDEPSDFEDLKAYPEPSVYSVSAEENSYLNSMEENYGGSY